MAGCSYGVLRRSPTTSAACSAPAPCPQTPVTRKQHMAAEHRSSAHRVCGCARVEVPGGGGRGLAQQACGKSKF